MELLAAAQTLICLIAILHDDVHVGLFHKGFLTVHMGDGA